MHYRSLPAGRATRRPVLFDTDTDDFWRPYMTQATQQQGYTPEKIPDILPILPLYDVVLFPKMVLPLIVMQEASIQLIDEAMSKDRIIGTVAASTKEAQSAYGPDELYTYGTSAVILKMAKAEDNKVQIILQ